MADETCRICGKPVPFTGALLSTLGIAHRQCVLPNDGPACPQLGKYEQIGTEIGRLVDEKSAAYGDSVGCSAAIFRELYPDGIKPEQYGDVLLMIRIVDKLKRIATNKDALGESPYRDIAGYGVLGAAKDGR